MKLDRVSLTNVDPQQTADATYAAIDALQRFPGPVRALAAACLLHLTSALRGLSPQDLMTPADNLMSSPEGQYRRTEFRATRAYLENEE